MTIYRKATVEEIIETYEREIRTGRRVSFRHFVREESYCRGRHGVRHVERSAGKLQVIDGAVCGKYYDQFEKLTATHVTLDNGMQFVADLRLDSPYLD